MKKQVNSALNDIGLIGWPPFLRDHLFVMALFFGIAAWTALWFFVVPTFTIDEQSLTKIIFLTVVWHPVLEEVFFRGIVQSALFNKSWGNKYFVGLSIANWLTSLLFVLAHLLYQPWIWAILVLLPSLAYGFFRDRYANIYPSILLHSFYNGGFVAINIIAQQ